MCEARTRLRRVRASHTSAVSRNQRLPLQTVVYSVSYTAIEAIRTQTALCGVRVDSLLIIFVEKLKVHI